MNFLQSILIIAVFIPAIICSRQSFDDEFSPDLRELILQSRAKVQLNAQCDWITYDLALGVKNRGNDYRCPAQTIVGGHCILPWSDAITLCNSDPDCEGLSFTTNQGWHNSYDKDKEPAVHLYKTPKTNEAPNAEWYIFNKNCWKLNT